MASRQSVRRSLNWDHREIENTPPKANSKAASKATDEGTDNSKDFDKSLKIVLSRSDTSSSFTITKSTTPIKSPRRNPLGSKQISDLLNTDEEEMDIEIDDNGRKSPTYDEPDVPKKFVIESPRRPASSKKRMSTARVVDENDESSEDDEIVLKKTPVKHNESRCRPVTPLASKSKASDNTPLKIALRNSSRNATPLKTTPSKMTKIKDSPKDKTRQISPSVHDSSQEGRRSSGRCRTAVKRFRPDEETSGDEAEESTSKSGKKPKLEKTTSPRIFGDKKSSKDPDFTPSRSKRTSTTITPSKGTPARGTPSKGTTARGTPSKGTPARGTPSKGTPAKQRGGRSRHQSESEVSSSDDDSSNMSDSSDKINVKKSEAKAKKAPQTKRRVMTPKIPARKIPLSDIVSPLQEAQLRLHVSAVPDNLPCRENEFAEIFAFTEAKVQDGIGGCMYISGVPGTGKTATVKEVMRQLNAMVDDGDLPAFKFIEINGMRLTEPNQAYVQIWKSLTNGDKVTSEHAKNLLEKRFTTDQGAKSKQMTVLLVDELDMLWNRKQSVLYNIFEWPTYKTAKLVVLAIANTMDLPERVMINRVCSRVGLTRLTFSPYNHQQLQEIVAARLAGLTVFDKDAVQLVARKVASLSGDARRALDICRRAAEIAQREEPPKVAPSPRKNATPSKKNRVEANSALVQLKHVTQAHQEMFCSPKILAICHCSKIEQMLLKVLVQIFQKTGIEETSLDRIFRTTNELINFEGMPALTEPGLNAMVGLLSASRLILIEPGKCGRLDMKVRLNISQDDITFALQAQRNDEE